MASGRIKPGWTLVAFGDVVRQVKDRVDPTAAGLERYVAGEHMDTDDLQIRRWGTVGNGYLGPAFHARFRPGQVLYGSRRTYLRKVAVADFEGVTANTTFVIETKDPNVLLAALLPFIMQTEAFHGYSIKKSKGSVNPYVNFSDIAAYEFALPPLGEQRRIATVLGHGSGFVDTFATLVQALRQLERATFDALLTNSPGHSTALGSLLMAPPRNGSSAVEAASATGHWVLSLSALTKDGYRTGQLKPVQPTAAMLAARLQLGDLLMSRSNTRELVGTAGIFAEDRPDVSWPDTMMRLVPDPGSIRSRFLERFLRSSTGRRQIQSFAAGTSASMKKINASTVKMLTITVPPLHSQDRIIAATDTVRLAQAAAESRRANLVAWRNRWLNHVLGGNRHSEIGQQ